MQMESSYILQMPDYSAQIFQNKKNFKYTVYGYYEYMDNDLETEL